MLAGPGHHGSQDRCHLRLVMVITETLADRARFQWDVACVAWVTFFMCHIKSHVSHETLMCPEDRGQEFREQRESKVSRVRRYADRKGAALWWHRVVTTTSTTGGTGAWQEAAATSPLQLPPSPGK